MIRALLASCALVALAGCATPLSFADPDEITLPKAMDSAACALATYTNSLAAYRVRPGTFTDTIEANFQVKGSAKNNSDLVIDSNFGAIGPLSSLGINYANKNETYGERGNNIKIIMRNMYTVTLNKAGEKVVARDGPRLSTRRQTVLYERPCDPRDPGAYTVGPNPNAINYRDLLAGRE